MDPKLFEIFWVFFKISILSFGGVFGVLPELERMVVGEHGWITSERFIQSYVIAAFVPGPNMAMCPLIGYWVAGAAGFVAGFCGIYAGPILVMGAVERYFEKRKSFEWVQKFERALYPLVLGLMMAAGLRYWYTQTTSMHATDGVYSNLRAILFSLLMTVVGTWAYVRKKLGPMSLLFLTGGVWWLFNFLMAPT